DFSDDIHGTGQRAGCAGNRPHFRFAEAVISHARGVLMRRLCILSVSLGLLSSFGPVLAGSGVQASQSPSAPQVTPTPSNQGTQSAPGAPAQPSPTPVPE